MGKNIRRYYIPIFLLYAVCSTALFLIAYLLRSPDSVTFTRNVFWGELLLFLLWLPFGWFYRPGSENTDEFTAKQIAILPFLTILILGYVIVSGGVFICSLFIMDLGITGTIIQIVLGVVTLIVGLCLQMAMAHGAHGIENFSQDLARENIFPPSELSLRMTAFERRLAEDREAAELVKACRQAREGLTHRLPGAGKITSNPEYGTLSREIDAFLTTALPIEATRKEHVFTQIRAINDRMEFVVASLKR